jgi:hypothetical protein
LPSHEHDRRDEHGAGDAERDRGAVVPEEQRHQQRREERAEVDAPVEGVEHDLRAVLVGLIELIADERRDQWFDATGSERDRNRPV